MEESILIVAPTLRGLTFDGETGAIVAFEDSPSAVGPLLDAAQKDLVLSGPIFSDCGLIDGTFPMFIPSPTRGESAAVTTGRVVFAFGRYLEEYHVRPRIVVYGNLGCFALGESLDEALEALAAYERVLSELGRQGAGNPQGGRSPAPTTAPTSGRKAAAGSGSGATAEPRSGLGDRNRIVAGKVAIVTGGAQGFGEEIVRSLVAAGGLVFIADLNQEGGSRLARELNEAQRRTVAVPVKADVSTEDSVRSLIEQVVRTAGGIDLFISNAGVLRAASVKEQPASEFELVTRVNYSGFFLCTKWASRVMAAQNAPTGRYFTDIVQINSKSGLEGSNRNAAYAGSKFGGIGLTQSFALELVSDNIKVNAICPGNFFDGPLWSDPEKGLFVQYLRAGKVPGATTVAEVKRFYEEKVPMRRGCTGPDVVRAILYIVEQKYETGQALPVTGGQVMLS